MGIRLDLVNLVKDITPATWMHEPCSPCSTGMKHPLGMVPCGYLAFRSTIPEDKWGTTRSLYAPTELLWTLTLGRVVLSWDKRKIFIQVWKLKGEI